LIAPFEEFELGNYRKRNGLTAEDCTRINSELAKCRMLCAVCHRFKTLRSNDHAEHPAAVLMSTDVLSPSLSLSLFSFSGALKRNNEQFLRHFASKGRMSTLLAEQVPVYVVTNPHVGLLGAKLMAKRLIAAGPNAHSGHPLIKAKL
jgi:hypothetical protein